MVWEGRGLPTAEGLAAPLHSARYYCSSSVFGRSVSLCVASGGDSGDDRYCLLVVCVCSWGTTVPSGAPVL